MKKQTKGMVKKFLSILLAVVMVATCVPVQTEAAEKTASKTIEISVGETKALKSYSLLSKITWESSDDAVATVSPKGVVSGVSAGTATVTRTTKSMFIWFGSKPTVITYEIIVTDGQEEIPEGSEIPETPSKPEINKNWVNILLGKFFENIWGNSGIEKPNKPEKPNEPEKPEVKTYTVTFESNGGSFVESQTVEEGQCAEKPVDPEKEGFVFAGWHSDEELSEVYDFTVGVTLDITLYAGWEEGVIAEETDEDEDEVEDYIEELFGTDTEKEDTDGDGLSDYIEIYVVCTDPTKEDTDENGILDGEEDSDSDGLANNKELEIGTMPDRWDSDGDNLSDGQEVELGTDPLIYDTDMDGVNDGQEVELGTDPLISDEFFEITKASAEEGDCVSVSVDIELTGEQVDSLEIEAINNDTVFPDTMPGYIGKAYDFTVDGEFDSATISFEFDASLLDGVFDPVIYYFNETSQVLEALTTTIDGNIASAQVEHFSTYILLDRTIYEGSMTWEDTWETSESYSSVEIVFVVDDSGSMDSNDSGNQRLIVAQDLIDKLPDGTKVGIVWFASSAKLLTTEMTTDKDIAKSYLTPEYFKSSGGTYMYTAINQGFELYEDTENADVLKTMVVLSDGDSSGTSSHSSTIATAQAENVRIYTVGLGNSTSYFTRYLKPLAEETGGSFYLASEADELTAIYENINKQINLDTDTDHDDIPDYYEDNMIAFNGVKIPLDKTKADTDGDGIIDSDEVRVELVYSEDHSKVYVKGTILSHPTLKDSDYDGIIDKEDNAPLNNTFVGKLATDYSTMLVATNLDYRWFYGNNAEYNRKLSTMSILLSSVIYSGNDLTLNDSTSATILKKGKAEDVLKCFGMEKAQTYLLEDDYNDNHLSEVTFGYHNVVNNGELKTVLAAVIRGTNGTIEEWSSNFDIGDINTNDSAWVNKENHKGFDIAANRIEKLMDQYIINQDLDEDVLVYWVTGHSRGAGIANIIGANLEDKGKKAFTYTFASPNTTLASDASSYKTIFNVINEDDFVPCLPIDTWGYFRYGKSTATVRISDGYEKTWEAFTGIRDYNPDTLNMDKCVKAIGDVLSDGDDPRVAVYHYTCTCHGDNTNDNIKITNKGLTEASMNRALAKIPDNALPYCKIIKDKGGLLGGWDYHMCQTPAYFMQLLSANMANVIGKYRFVVELNIAKRYEKAKTAIAAAAVSGIEHPHYTESYYILANNITAGAFK